MTWDLDNDGKFDDGTGETPVFSAVGLDGPDDVTVAMRVCDTFDVCDEDAAQVRILNVAPTVDLGDDLEVYRNDVVALSGTFDHPAGALDDPYTADWNGDAPLTRATADADASGVGTSTALLLAERAGGGDGRVYHLAFSVTDGHGGQCTGTVAVGTPHDQRGSAPVDQGALYDSTTTG